MTPSFRRKPESRGWGFSYEDNACHAGYELSWEVMQRSPEGED